MHLLKIVSGSVHKGKGIDMLQTMNTGPILVVQGRIRGKYTTRLGNKMKLWGLYQGQTVIGVWGYRSHSKLMYEMYRDRIMEKYTPVGMIIMEIIPGAENTINRVYENTGLVWIQLLG